jgi:hypothetical protein
MLLQLGFRFLQSYFQSFELPILVVLKSIFEGLGMFFQALHLNLQILSLSLIVRQVIVA